jgi:uncharacterized membrane protein
MVAVHPLNQFNPFLNRGAMEHRSPIFIFQGENKMSTLTIFASIIATLILIWAVWFIVRFIQYVGSGEYEMDQRLRDICK